MIDQTAKGLRKKYLETVGIIVPDITNPHFAKLVLNIQTSLFQCGYSSIIGNTNENLSLEEEHVHSLKSQHVCGFIMISTKRYHQSLRRFPMVYLDRPAKGGEKEDITIESDNFKGGYLAGKQLGIASCKRIRTNSNDCNQDTRKEGFLKALSEAGISEESSVSAIYFGTGVGNAVFLNGRILLGKNGVASELGHLPVLLNEKKCSCGNVGCLETIVSGIALQALQKEKFPNIRIDDIFTEEKDDPEVDLFVRNMAKVIATEENLFDPDYILLGGGLPMMNGFPKERLEKYAHEFTRKPYPEQNMEIVYSKMDQKNGVLGACLYGKKRLEGSSYL